MASAWPAARCGRRWRRGARTKSARRAGTDGSARRATRHRAGRPRSARQVRRATNEPLAAAANLRRVRRRGGRAAWRRVDASDALGARSARLRRTACVGGRRARTARRTARPGRTRVRLAAARAAIVLGTSSTARAARRVPHHARGAREPGRCAARDGLAMGRARSATQPRGRSASARPRVAAATAQDEAPDLGGQRRPIAIKVPRPRPTRRSQRSATTPSRIGRHADGSAYIVIASPTVCRPTSTRSRGAHQALRSSGDRTACVS